MAIETGILWTDSTFNPWWGCTKIAPGCDNCYAEDLDRRNGGNHWGVGTKPRVTGDKNWKQPIKWNKAAASGKPHKVFCGSMCDWTDNNVEPEVRDRLWDLIRATPHLTWQLLTKRATNIEKCLPADWGDGYANVWLGVTVEDKAFGLKRMEVLKKIPAKVRFLSCEPLLEDLGVVDLDGIHWVIVGGESGPNARPMHGDWAVNVIASAYEQGVPVFFKQWGGAETKGGCEIFGSEIKEFPLA